MFNFECVGFEAGRCPAGINQGEEPQLSSPSYNYSLSQCKCIVITAIFPKVCQSHINKFKENINRKWHQPYRNFKNVFLVCQHMHIFLFPTLCTTSLLHNFFRDYWQVSSMSSTSSYSPGPRIVHQCT